MNAGAKLSAYGAVIAVVFAGAWTAGNAIGPVSPDMRRDARNHEGGHVTDHAQLRDQGPVPITPAPPSGQPIQQPPPADVQSVAANPSRNATRTARRSPEPVAGPVTIVPSGGKLRWVAPPAERTPGARRNHHGDGPQGRDGSREHNHDQPQGRGKR